MIFANLTSNWIFVLVPILAVVYGVSSRQSKKRLAGYIHPNLWTKVITSFSETKRIWQKICFLLGLIFLILALMQPRLGFSYQKITHVGQDIIIALDTSKSMMVPDISPTRFDHAKSMISAMIDQFKGDRVGLVVFSGKAFIQCPLTRDYAALKLFLDDIYVGQVPFLGTNIASALSVGRGALRKKNNKQKSIIVFSDGETFEGDALEEAKAAAKQAITVYTVGLGTEAGDPIPVTNKSGVFDGYKRDSNGKIILSKRDDSTLLSIANLTKGEYFKVDKNSYITDQLYAHMAKSQNSSDEKSTKKVYVERYQWFLFLTLLFWILGFTLPLISKQTGAKLVVVLFALFMFQGPVEAVNLKTYFLNRQGVKAMKQTQYDKALEYFFEAENEDPNSSVIQVNKGNAFYQKKAYQDAKKSYTNALKLQKDKLSPEVLYNFANTAYQMADYGQAISLYKQVLMETPDDIHAKYNLELAIKMKQEMDNQNSPSPNGDDDKNKSEDQDKKSSDNKQQQNKEQGESEDKQNNDSSQENDKNKDKNKDKDSQDKSDGGGDNKQPANTSKQGEKIENIERLLRALEDKEKEARAVYYRQQAAESSKETTGENDW